MPVSQRLSPIPPPNNSERANRNGASDKNHHQVRWKADSSQGLCPYHAEKNRATVTGFIKSDLPRYSLTATQEATLISTTRAAPQPKEIDARGNGRQKSNDTSINQARGCVLCKKYRRRDTAKR
jgi:hypothetical protein